MTKLAYCLKLLEDINNKSPDYSIALAQDIEAARKEIKELYGILNETLVREYQNTSRDEERFIDYMAGDFFE